MIKLDLKKGFGKEEALTTLQKAINQRTNNIRYLIDIKDSGIYKPEYINTLYSDLNDCIQAMEYVKHNLR